MAVLTQSGLSEQMVAQLRLLKPSISAEVGTPERLIIDTVAQSLADSSIDLVGLQQALDIDTKFGSNLDRFVELFGFARQTAAPARGFVVFSRNAPSNFDILIPAGTIIKPNAANDHDGGVEFVTTASATLTAGETQSGFVPVESAHGGTGGNLPAGALTVMSLAPVLGITGVTNPGATSGGSDQEDDNSLKVRFKNTVFRNLAGTEDQFLALSVATAFSTKANVVGPVSKYQEYVQVPTKDDAHAASYGGAGSAEYPGTTPNFITRGTTNGTPFTTLTVPSTAGMSSGEPFILYEGGLNPLKSFKGTITVAGPTTLVLAYVAPPVQAITEGALLVGPLTTGPYTNLWTTALSTIPYAKDIWTALPIFISNSVSGISKFFFREGVDFKFNYPALRQGDALRAYIDGVGLDALIDPLGKTQPNITFTNVYQGSENAIQALGPEDVVLLEYAYTSTASRNSLAHNVTNAVDVYVDGGNDQPTTTNFTAPPTTAQIFVDSSLSMYHYENYRRDGEPTKRPLEGNILTPLFRQPITALPEQVIIGESRYYLGVHYWLVHETASYGGTIRARDGIEWSSTTPGDKGGSGEGLPTTEVEEPEYTGALFSNLGLSTIVEIENYFFDQNIEDLQATLEAARQITTDVLAHRAKKRYFKLDITVIYTPGSSIPTTNEAIRGAVTSFLANQYFGAVIQLSDLLQVIHNVGGVDNVRWSNDVPNTNDLVRVYETDNHGAPLRGVAVDRAEWGSGTLKEVQRLYLVGNPTGGTFTLKGLVDGTTKNSLPIAIQGITAGTIEEAINDINHSLKTVKVTEDERSTTGVNYPIRSFTLTYGLGAKKLPTVAQTMTGGEYVFDNDFFLHDDELPTLPSEMQAGDTVAGLIIRPRAQNVWQKG